MSSSSGIIYVAFMMALFATLAIAILRHERQERESLPPSARLPDLKTPSPQKTRKRPKPPPALSLPPMANGVRSGGGVGGGDRIGLGDAGEEAKIAKKIAENVSTPRRRGGERGEGGGEHGHGDGGGRGIKFAYPVVVGVVETFGQIFSVALSRMTYSSMKECDDVVDSPEHPDDVVVDSLEQPDDALEDASECVNSFHWLIYWVVLVFVVPCFVSQASWRWALWALGECGEVVTRQSGGRPNHRCPSVCRPSDKQWRRV